MKIVSLVPSWTETLVEAGLDVVGRTRFCIHPRAEVISIATVGGTKNPDIEKIKVIEPDLIILDKEENTKQTADQLNMFRQHVTHVRSMTDLPEQLFEMAESFDKKPEAALYLKNLSNRWRKLCNTEVPISDIDELPGVITWVSKPKTAPKKLIYLIWHNPWMSVSKSTFIGSVLGWLNLNIELFDSDANYPEITAKELDSDSNLLLASSEPFPFERKSNLLSELSASAATVDGEVYSWFGVRSLVALEHWLNQKIN
ncbi:MAG: Fe3+-siderophores ABC transporter protein [Bdellovibrionales bacterium]|nr:Fe3+-siderophores ABC transporter protein [Bdellovibrionales bacterium]